jgi:branched-chain amino acid transport system substrate-binding protein
MFHINLRTAARAVAIALFALSVSAAGAHAADPIKVGFSMALTGGVAPNGKQLLAALELWRDDVNAKGGLIGRPVQLVHYDDQSNPANVPGIYTKLITVDKVDLTIGPYATNMIAPAMPVLMQHNKMTIGILGVNVNRQFNYGRYFSMIPGGPEGTLAFSRGWFELAMAQNPKPKSVAIVAADAEFGRAACDGARDNAKQAGLEFAYDRTYPPFATDLMPVARAVQATNPDLVFVCAYPPDTVAFVRAAAEIGLNPKMLGGMLVGLFATGIKMQLGPLVNGLVIGESFLPALDFPGLRDVMARYQAGAPARGIDPLGYGYVPFGYAAGQVLAAAVEATKSLDDAKLAEHIHANRFQTVAGELAFGKDGEWVMARQFFTQFQNVTGNTLDQFRDPAKEVILWPDAYKTGTLVYPYVAAKKK